MIIKTAHCDRCKFQQQMNLNDNNLPLKWKEFQTDTHIYLLCPTCARTLTTKLNDLTRIFVNNSGKRILINTFEDDNLKY